MKMTLRAILFSIVLLMGNSNFANSATMQVIDQLSDNEMKSIVISGDIVRGDANEFLSLSLDAKAAIVFLASNGGDAAEGLLIGKALHRLGYATAVIANYPCLSACALIWVSGTTRFLAKDAVVGFHAVYTTDGVSSDGNAIYGAFYGQLGLSDRAIRYLTSAPPSDFNRVTLETAPLLDISVNPWASTGEKTEQADQPKISKDFVVENGLAISGFDLPNQAIKSADGNECKASCSNTQSCNAYTFDLKASICYLKSGGRVAFRNSLTQSGARVELNSQLLKSSIRLIREADIVGNDLLNFRAKHIEECIFSCEKSESCAAFTYSKKQKTCWLKSTDKPRQFNKSLTSGVK
jgi:PAN domain